MTLVNSQQTAGRTVAGTGGVRGVGEAGSAAEVERAAPFADDRLTTMGLLAETAAGLAARAGAQLAELGLSGVEFEILIRLARSPRGLLRMSDLAAQSRLTASGVTRVVDRLAERGLVARQDCATDRRTTFAVITEPGNDLMAAAMPRHLELIETYLTGPLTAAGDLETFTDSLRRLRDHVVPCSTAGSDSAAELPLGQRPTSR